MQAGHNSTPGVASVAAWCLGVGGHSGDNSDGDDCDGNCDGNVMRWWGVAMKRGCVFPRWGDEMTVSDGDEAGVHAANNAGAGATTEQFACT